MTDTFFMRLAIDASKRGDYPYGAVLVKDGEIVTQACNTCARDSDPTAHAEMNVIRRAAKLLPGGSFEGCTLFSSSEPCPMCAGAIVWARIPRVVFGGSIEQLMALGQSQINAPSQQLFELGFSTIDARGGVLAWQALEVFGE